MAPSPFRRRKAAKAVRNLAIAEAALALAKDRVVPGTGGSKRSRGKLLLLGGAVAAAGAAALLKRDKVAGLLPSRTSESEPAPPAPPQPSNYDAPGPVANTSTPIPAPDPRGEPPATIDEDAEETAAAAEAAAIGGTTSDYVGAGGEPAGEAERPLAEAGEGESEGQEQAEAALADNASYRDAAPSAAERQIDEAIEQADQPTAGETPEPVVSDDTPDAPPAGTQETFLPPSPPAHAEPAPTPEAAETPEPPPVPATGDATNDTTADVPGGGISGRPYAGLDSPPAPEPSPGAEAATDEPSPGAGEPAPESSPAAETEPEPAPAAEEEQKDDSDDWRTWSGRSVNP